MEAQHLNPSSLSQDSEALTTVPLCRFNRTNTGNLTMVASATSSVLGHGSWALSTVQNLSLSVKEIGTEPISDYREAEHLILGR